MADKVADLYAKVSFDVDKKGLQEAQKLLSEFAKQMSAINGLLKSQASINGILSKERAKQDTEREKQATEQKKAETQRIKQSIKEITHKQQLERMARKEEMQDKRFQQKEQEHLWRMEERASKTHHSNMAKYARQGATGLLRIARNSLKLLANATRATWKNVIAPSLSGAVDVRDFMMYTGMNLNTLQGIQERFASVGSAMSRQDIMSELSAVMDNLTKIRFGQGSLVGQKLLGISAAAQKRDFNKVLSIIEQAGVGVDNQAFVETLNQMGFSGQQWLPYFRARQRVNSALPRLDMAGQENLLEANASIQTFALGLQRSGEILTAKFSPVLKSVSDKLIDFLNRWVSNINVKKFGAAIDRLVDDFTRWADTISAEDIENWVRNLLNAVVSIIDGLVWFANKLGMLKRAAGGAAKATAALFTGHPKDAVREIIQAQRDLINRNSSYVQNHITLKQEIYGVENKDIAEKVEEAGTKILSSGVKFGETYVTAGLAGG